MSLNSETFAQYTDPADSMVSVTAGSWVPGHVCNCRRLCVWRTEDNFQELVLAFPVSFLFCMHMEVPR